MSKDKLYLTITRTEFHSIMDKQLSAMGLPRVVDGTPTTDTLLAAFLEESHYQSDGLDGIMIDLERKS